MLHTLAMWHFDISVIYPQGFLYPPLQQSWKGGILVSPCLSDLLHHLEKGKEELSPLQFHIKSLHIISRHYKKSLLRSQIYHGYEELSTDTNYTIWRRQERRSKYAVQLASWQPRSNSPKMSVCPSVRLWTESCPLCIFNNTCWILFIFAHLIKQLQKVCRV